MRWLARHTITDYPQGATRLHRRFAWLPVYISGSRVWLEFFEILQMYNVLTYTAKVDDTDVSFRVGNWINLSKRVIV